ncbi:MAG: ribonuclease P protein component [Candidatus Sedimenticola endophacoides]|uniref:Ribonuclease P protein component n=1 Tax=Candidatus Sedimenticola endophacoides TaxID=2548426 RepID=A0A6N4DYD2_9GAMM|nr:MAG: ribonuclease P protein component [Candidatus Sedimenticola endophacoides]PUE02518.1 MAG: ribonuclease P protein component [Candidatus Sedimenticola endophacoides]PUE02672.1 MAG: ribonuclease P protein component [Candidatus Sedimenticola endophacoides]
MIHRPLHPHEARFPRGARLLKPAEFSRVFKQAVRSADDCFTILCRRSDQGRARLGLAIAKKSVKRAVDRNRLKRVVRESFRHHQRHLHGIDCVVMARRELPLGDRRRLNGSLEQHWKRLARRCNET